MKTLGVSSKGLRLDLESFTSLVSSDFLRLKQFTDRFLASNPQRERIAIQASETYFDDLTSLSIEDFGAILQKWDVLSADEIMSMYKVAIVIMFGYAHQLKWAGFNIIEPTSFPELSEKLLFARESIFKVALALVLFLRLSQGPNSFSQHGVIREAYNLGFRVGLALGFLTDEFHSRGRGHVLSLLKGKRF